MTENQVEKAKTSADFLLKEVGQRNTEVAAWILFSAARVYDRIGDQKSGEMDEAAIKSTRNLKRLPGSGFWSRKLAIVYLFHNETDRAEKCIRHALEVETKRFHKEHPRVANCHMTLANVLTQNKKASEARSHIMTALSIRNKHLPKNSKMILECKRKLAELRNNN